MISAEVISLTEGKEEKVSLPSKIFGAKINKVLLSQAVRVFLSNQRKARAKAKTRAEVSRTKKKWYRQKGTGRARHGSRSAPIFVGGGKAHGPHGIENYKKFLPKKMRFLALASALSAKAGEKEIVVLEGLEKIKGTKEMGKLLEKLSSPKGKGFLLVLPGKFTNVISASRNIPGLELVQVNSLNAYQVLRAGKILFVKEAIKVLEDLWIKD